MIALVLLSSATALAQVEVHDHRTDSKKKMPPPPPTWDATGWTKLGELTVDGKNDHDALLVGQEEGKFAKLTIVVEDSDLEMFDIKVHFRNGDVFDPKTRIVFGESSRTGAIDLPGDARTIEKIDFHYGNLPGGGKAEVAVYGLAVVPAADQPPPPPPVVWDDKGWVKLGERVINGKHDRDTIIVGAYEGKFDQLTFVVGDADMQFAKVTVVFANNKKWSPRISGFTFAEGSRTAVLDIPGNNRRIKRIDLRYRNVSHDQATVSVYGRDTRAGDVVVHDHRGEASTAGFDSTGWTLLGEQAVNGQRDVDTILVPKKRGALSKIMLVVLDGNLEMKSVVVSFRGGRARSLDVKKTFQEGDRTRALELPKTKRNVRSIQLVYGNLGGGANARVQIWAQ